MVFKRSKTFPKRILLNVFKILKIKSIESQLSEKKENEDFLLNSAR